MFHEVKTALSTLSESDSVGRRFRTRCGRLLEVFTDPDSRWMFKDRNLAASGLKSLMVRAKRPIHFIYLLWISIMVYTGNMLVEMA